MALPTDALTHSAYSKSRRARMTLPPRCRLTFSSVVNACAMTFSRSGVLALCVMSFPEWHVIVNEWPQNAVGVMLRQRP
jgi:hypothetical protein